jgi:glyoxylase I family protein
MTGQRAARHDGTYAFVMVVARNAGSVLRIVAVHQDARPAMHPVHLNRAQLGGAATEPAGWSDGHTPPTRRPQQRDRPSVIRKALAREARRGEAVCMVEDLGRPRQVGMSHLGFSVTDLDRSVEFYCDVLGAVLVRAQYEGDSPSFSGRMALVMLGSNGLDLYEHAGNDAERFEPARTGLDHLALVAESFEHLQTWADWLDACEVPRSEIRDVGVGAMFDFVDPDGIQIEFCFTDPTKLPESGWHSSSRGSP